MLNKGGWEVRKKPWGNQSYLATSREDIIEAHKILAFWFTDSPFSRLYSSGDRWCLNAKKLQFWLIFPNRNYKSRSKEYNFKWCWHHTLHLKKNTFPVFEICYKHQEQKRRSSAAWRYGWLTCVYMHAPPRMVPKFP